jgi:hypothetical protein
MTDEDTRIFFRLSRVSQRAFPTFETAADRAAFVDAQLMTDIERIKADAVKRVRQLQAKGRL